MRLSKAVFSPLLYPSGLFFDIPTTALRDSHRLCGELNLFPLTNDLEVLDIETNVDAHHLLFTREEWERLDGVLSQGFSRLHTVAICVAFWIWKG